MSKQFGFRIRGLRVSFGLTQAQLAEKVNKAESTVRMWELGKSEPDNSTLILLAKIFNKPTDFILGVTDEAAPPNLIIPEELHDVQIALHRGEFEDLNQYEIDKLAEFARFLKSQRKEE